MDRPGGALAQAEELDLILSNHSKQAQGDNCNKIKAVVQQARDSPMTEQEVSTCDTSIIILGNRRKRANAARLSLKVLSVSAPDL